MVQEVKDILQIALQIVNLIVIFYGGYKFLNKPHDTLEERQEALEKRVDKQDLKIETIEDALHKGNDKFRKQEETNATFKSVMLSFVNFEIAYCRNTGYEDNQDLLDAKKELSEYLTGKNHEERNRD